MDLKTMRYFLAVAEEKNITKAAKTLAMAQPPLSVQMHRLEEELGTPLFIRGKRSLELTDAGKLLYKRAKDIIALSNKTTEEIGAMANGLSGTISLGFAGNFDNKLLSKTVKEFQNEHPGVSFSLSIGGSNTLLEQVNEGRLSLAFVAAPYDEGILNGILLDERSFVALLPSSHPLAKKKTIHIQDLREEPLILPARVEEIDAARKLFRKNQIEPKVVARADDESLTKELVLEGLGIAISVKPNDIDKTVVSRPIEGIGKPLRYYLVWRKGHPLPRIEEEFIDFLKAKGPDRIR